MAIQKVDQIVVNLCMEVFKLKLFFYKTQIDRQSTNAGVLKKVFVIFVTFYVSYQYGSYALLL